MESEEYMEDPSLATRIGMLKESMSSLQTIVFSMSKMLEQILEIVQYRATMNTLIEEVKYDIPELKDEGHFTVIEHDDLSMGIQQVFRVEDRDQVLEMKEGVFTPIDIGLGVRVEVGIYYNTLEWILDMVRLWREVAHDVAVSKIEEEVVVLTMKNKR
ncbi:hypothetical protein PVK06_010691 [Gossypium arboreum]|uniref:Uncharacterized protein n=1 Tax=Gossypium arboreum TaxID=29729 RepID=A0ABR0Q7H5_GOSAR|nr:hypothetical protein PVK06_010691 [Gossypium arboreum]